jgi:hypothetical protein
MYFGKPIPQWIIEHKDDTITLGEIVDACERSRRVLERLMQKSYENDKDGQMLTAYVYFADKWERCNAPVDLALSILGERYGYPDNPPEEEEE